MSMLNRFRKPGGFQQLLTLIETCEPAKQKSLLHLVGSEDPGWAHLLKLKALTFERILSWPVEALIEVTPHLPDLVLATAYQMAQNISKTTNSNLHEKWMSCLPAIKAKEISDLSSNHVFNAAEQSAASIKIIFVVRELEEKGRIRFANFDPMLEIDRRLTA